MNNYIDKHGRIHNKPVTAKNEYPCNNSFLYSGEASLIGVPVNEISVHTGFALCDAFSQQIKYGYNRNPDGEKLPASSHDEIVGLFMLPDRNSFSKALYKKLEKQHFQVCNLEGFNPTPIYKLNPFKVISQLRKLSSEENPRKATPNYPYIWPIVFRHAPQHTYFYSRCAGVRVSLLHSLYTLGASLATIYRGDNSSRVMLGFKLLKLKKIGPSFLERLVTKIYNRKLEFGTEVRMYFPDDHPITLAVPEKV